MQHERTTTAGVAPAEPHASSRHGFLVLICTSAPCFMLQLDTNIVSVSLPAIARSLNASFSGIEWVITAYILSYASLLLPAGALADRFGRRNVLLTGLTIFTIASLCCGLAPTLPLLIAARAVQGAGAAMQLSAALATLSHEFQGEARARAFASWGAVVGAGIAFGPVVGGIITQAFGWEWAFFVNIPIGVALILLIMRVIESSRDPHALRLDVAGVLTFGSALFLTTLALIEGNHRGWSDPWIVGEFAGAAALFVVFLIVEARQERPMLDLSYFRMRTYVGANIAQFTFAAGMLTMLTFVPIFLQSGLGYSPSVSGLMMLPMVMPLFVVPRLAARHLSHRLSGRTLLTSGLFLVAAGSFWIALTVELLAYGPLVAGMLIVGLGGAILNGETTKVGMALIPKERSGMASGVQGTMRFTGLVIGIAALGAVLYGSISLAMQQALPQAVDAERMTLVQAITAGQLSETGLSGQGQASLRSLALASFAEGHRWLFLASAVFVALSTILTWLLVSAADTPPVQTPPVQTPPRADRRSGAS